MVVVCLLQILPAPLNNYKVFSFIFIQLVGISAMSNLRPDFYSSSRITKEVVYKYSFRLYILTLSLLFHTTYLWFTSNKNNMTCFLAFIILLYSQTKHLYKQEILPKTLDDRKLSTKLYNRYKFLNYLFE